MFNSRTLYGSDMVQIWYTYLIDDYFDPTLTEPSSDVNELDIADGLKDLLIEHGFDIKRLLTTSPEDIAKSLNIELHVAEIIHDAAMKYSNSNHQSKSFES